MTQYEVHARKSDEGTSTHDSNKWILMANFQYSPVKSIYVSEADVRIFPNPVTDIHFSGLDDDEADLIIKDMTGKEVYSVKKNCRHLLLIFPN
ncbi:MAG: hypothetical protein IPJ13_14460 [Saprospiraceae bacterium]|nr:hypothetical protein [Saprospiraceae bacterium]